MIYLERFCSKPIITLDTTYSAMGNVRGLNYKQTTPDSSVYVWDNAKKAGLRATSRLVASHTHKKTAWFFILTFPPLDKEIKPFSYDI